MTKMSLGRCWGHGHGRVKTRRCIARVSPRTRAGSRTGAGGAGDTRCAQAEGVESHRVMLEIHTDMAAHKLRGEVSNQDSSILATMKSKSEKPDREELFALTS